MSTDQNRDRAILKRMLSAAFIFVILLLPFQNCSNGGFAVKEDFSTSLGSSSFGFIPAKSSGIRPLTVREYNAAVNLLIGDTSNFGSRFLPEETFEPFDNAIESASVSSAKIQGYEAAAKELTAAFLGSTVRMQKYLPCIPTGVSDRTCFTNIVNQIGLNAFRRPLTDAERTQFVDAIASFATKGGNYTAGLNVFFNVILQHPMFVYRWETGVVNSSKVYQLNDYELASRLSFTLFGLPPDAELLADAAARRLTQPDSYKIIVDRMLDDPRTLNHIDFFHASWLGYQGMDGSTAVSSAMRAESKALIKRVVVEQNRPWTDIFTSRETFLDRTLAAHYGMPAPSGESGWIRYPDFTRGGILSHGTFLSVGAKFGDTSPIQRGYHIRKQLFCEKISPPPPGIDVDTPPMAVDTNVACKEANHLGSTLRSGTSCVSCHSRMDPIGFGLERYSSLGQFRTSEPTRPECAISGNGSAAPYGSFNGPGELGTLVVNSGRIERCMVERWIQLTYGVKDQSDQAEMAAKYFADFKSTGRLTDLLRAFVMDADFSHRKTLESK